ncbi:50S ribosomal protein L31 [Wolbachia endosymbiont of Howardula sp.]|uniref:50S ribosomal protein L31 n=1 Tax=Wolbachia endosymbiont of Howardula sp. TaxID=2916816 RepID=UPI00217E3796|nr:50S ribosomal protein L31 [Wolbachia endosymbiont of Howardula sp.]UWI83135.1 50S ribosomal protein L31 [Wolbachia endosymbiont of Howardula sp.]
MIKAVISYHKVIIVMTNGQEFETRSTYGTEGNRIKLDRDPLTHPAWTKTLTSGSLSKASKLAKFNNKYGDIF